MSSVSESDDYSPESAPQPVKRRPRGTMTAEERRDARAHRNRLAAQSSRDRKKALFEQLSQRVAELEEENRSLRLDMRRSSLSSFASSSSPALSDAVISQENAELQARIRQLEQAWHNMSKILGSVSIPLPQPPPPPSTHNFSRPTPSQPTVLPISPATSSVPDTIDALTRSTRELAAGGSIVTSVNNQATVGAGTMGQTTMFNYGSTVDNQPSTSPVSLRDAQRSPPTESFAELEQLLGFLSTRGDEPRLEPSPGPSTDNKEDWSWLNEGAF